MRYFLKLSYNGSRFHGWQCQPNAISVQGTLEEALSKVLRTPIQVTGAGRTDTGVHARIMYAHFNTEIPISDTDRFLSSLNSLSGKDIAIKSLIEVSQEAHARFDATERTYKYFVSFTKDPFLYPFCWKASSRLDVHLMNKAAQLLYSCRDFTSFAKLHSDSKTNICDVRKAIWTPIKEDTAANDFIGDLNDGIVFTISADRFLRNMVRAVVGTLVEIGRHKMTIGDFKNIIEAKNRCLAGTSMPANALFLWDIKYPYLS